MQSVGHVRAIWIPKKYEEVKLKVSIIDLSGATAIENAGRSTLFIWLHTVVRSLPSVDVSIPRHRRRLAMQLIL